MPACAATSSTGSPSPQMMALFARGDFRQAGHIHRNHVHRHAPDKRIARAADQHGRAIREVPRKTIAVTRGENRDGAVALGAPGTGITHRFAASSRPHGEHGGSSVITGFSPCVWAVRAERRNPVQHQPRPHPIAVRVRPSQDGRGVGDARHGRGEPGATSFSRAPTDGRAARRSWTASISSARARCVNTRSSNAGTVSARSRASASESLPARNPGGSCRCRSSSRR